MKQYEVWRRWFVYKNGMEPLPKDAWNGALRLIKEAENPVKQQMKLYHVENPTIAGEIVSERFVGSLTGYVEILFEQNVSLSGNPDRFARDWICNSNLLYETPRLAFENSLAAKRSDADSMSTETKSNN